MARVVVVEDSPVTRQLLSAIVEAAGHELLAACDNGLAGLQAIQEHRPDVALLDMLLPQLDGVQVLQRLQALGISVPVIMLSSVTSADRIQAARAAGVRHYLLKPFDAQKVMATMARVLSGGTGPLAPAAAPPLPPPATALRQDTLSPAPNLPPLVPPSPAALAPQPSQGSPLQAGQAAPPSGPAPGVLGQGPAVGAPGVGGSPPASAPNLAPPQPALQGQGVSPPPAVGGQWAGPRPFTGPPI